MIDQKAIVIPGPDCDGLWDRGVSGFGPNTVPKTGFTSSKQIRYLPGGFRTRQGYTTVATQVNWASPRQIIQYAANEISGFIILNAGQVFDSASPTPNTAILTPLNFSNTYISIICIFGKIFITEHDLNAGIQNTGATTRVYIYTPGSGIQARPAAGINAQLAACNFVSSATAGNVTQGLHIFGVAFESDSGFITPLGFVEGSPGTSSVASFTLTLTNRSVDITGIPLGPTGTVKRHILASKVVTGYSGNPTDYEIFFVAEVAGNVSTTLTFNFTDESLVDSADYLYSELGQIPPALGFCWYSNRLINYGERYYGALFEIGPSVLRVSSPGQPESFDVATGVVEVFKDDGEFGVYNCFEQDGLLVICKLNKTYVTRDNGGDPNTWEVATVDYSIGSIVFGVTKALNTTGATRTGKTITLSKTGVQLFQGQYLENPLSWKIGRRWKELVAQANYKLFQILDVPTAQLFLISVKDTTYNQFYWLVGDYSRGLDWQNIRWSEWHTNESTAFMTLHDNNTVYFVDAISNVINTMTFGTINDFSVVKDNGTAIANCEFTTSEIKFDDQLNTYQLIQVRIRGHVFEQPDIGPPPALLFGDDIQGFSSIGSPTPVFTPFIVNPIPEIIKAIVNRSGHYLRMRLTWTGQDVEVRHLVIYGKTSAMDKTTV